jgi:hypothetical protein
MGKTVTFFFFFQSTTIYMLNIHVDVDVDLPAKCLNPQNFAVFFPHGVNQFVKKHLT